MRKILTIGVALLSGLTAWAQSIPTYTTLTGTGTTAVTLYFPSSPLQQIRFVGAIATSDKVGAVISFQSGGAAQSVTISNASGTSISVAATNGWAANDVLVLEGKNGTTNVTISAFTGSTNITCSASTGFATLPGDQLYKLGTAATLPVGAASVNFQGEALFVGTRGRPVRVVVDGTSSVTASAITGRYE